MDRFPKSSRKLYDYVSVCIIIVTEIKMAICT